MRPEIELVGSNISLDTLKYIASRISKRDLNTITDSDILYNFTNMLNFYRIIFIATTSLRLYLKISGYIDIIDKQILESEFVTDNAHERTVNRIEKSIGLLINKEFKEDVEKYHISPHAAVRFAFEITAIDLADHLLPFLFSELNDKEALFLGSNILSLFCLSNKNILILIKERLKRNEDFWKKINDDFNRAMKYLFEMALRTFGVWQGYECLMTTRF